MEIVIKDESADASSISSSSQNCHRLSTAYLHCGVLRGKVHLCISLVQSKPQQHSLLHILSEALLLVIFFLFLNPSHQVIFIYFPISMFMTQESSLVRRQECGVGNGGGRGRSECKG